jgi:probable selenium-dependent hydroxylase accessory protein YqeC
VLEAFGIRRGDVICLVGAGGKTSLMFRLAQEARAQGLKVLVTTSTRIRVPDPEQYDAIDLSGKLFAEQPVTNPGIYVGGLPDSAPGKMTGVREDLLAWRKKQFDLILIEADGSAGKPLKGWKSTEPVIPEFTTGTIGIVDIQAIGQTISDSLVHRLEIFSGLTGGRKGEPVSIGHILRIISHDEGLFAQAIGTELLYLNKVESEHDHRNADILRAQLENLKIVAGSVRQGTIHV